jgi:Transposase DDE domain
MSSSPLPTRSATDQTFLQSFLQIPGLPFDDVLTAADCQRLFTTHGVPLETATPAGTSPAPEHSPTPTAPADPAALTTGTGPEGHPPTAGPPPRLAAPCPIWTPVVTLWTFLHQVVSTSKCCTAAVLRTVVLLTSLRGDPCSENPGAYSKARRRLPLELLKDLTILVGKRLDAACPTSWRWHGRRVLVVDGFVLSLPDTPDNQQVYPQPKSQKKGLGFPQVRLVGLFSLVGQVVVGVKWGPCQGKRTGETALLRDIFDQLQPGDVVVADRYYCSYFMIVLLKQRGVEVVFHLHQRRRHVFGTGQRLGDEDELVVWTKPTQCPEWLSLEIYAELPETLQVRLVGVAVQQRGFRTQYVHIVTTVLDAVEYRREEVTSLYKKRWQVEGMIRSLKTYMSMDRLRCRTPDLVHKEIWAYLLAYNLIRKTMAQAALRHGYEPWQISFSQTLQALDSYRYALAVASPEEAGLRGEQLLEGLTKVRVGQRPDRVEPRQVKRRPKPYRRLMKPRAEARQEICDRPGGEPRQKKPRGSQRPGVSEANRGGTAVGRK